MKKQTVVLSIIIFAWFGSCYAQDMGDLLHDAKALVEAKAFVEAKKLYEEAFQKFPESKENTEVLYNYALCIENISGEQASVPFYRELANFDEVDYNVARAINVLGIFQRYKSNYDSAFYYFNKILPYAEHLQFAPVYSNLRWYYIDRGDYVSATKYALKTLKTDEEKRDSIGIAVSLTNLGEIQIFQEEYHDALEKFEQSNVIQEKIKHDVSLSQNYENIGIVYQQLDSLEAAKFWFLKALGNDKKKEDQRGAAFSMMQLGVLETMLENFLKSTKYFRKSEAYFLNDASLFDRSVFYKNLGFALQKQGKWLSAIEKYKLAVKGFEEINAAEKLMYCYNNLSRCHSEVKNYGQAYEYLREHLKVKVKIDDEAIKKQVEDLSLQYETEKKERQILQQQNELIANKAKFSRYQTVFLITLLLISGALFVYRYFSLRREKKLNSAFQATYMNILQLKKHFEGKGDTFEKVKITADTDQLADHINTELGFVTSDIDEKLRSSTSFNYTVSHELKRYLSQLETDIVEIDSQSKNNAAVAESLQKVSHLNNLISKLLELSSIEKGALHITQFDLEQLIDQCIEELQIPNSIVITYHLAVKNIYADRLLLRQVIANVLENAGKYLMNVPNPEIKISSQFNEAFLEVFVSDNGPGITDTYKREQVFDAFFQAGSAQKGNGLGLAIVKKIIERHDGYVVALQNKPDGLTVGFGVPFQG